MTCSLTLVRVQIERAGTNLNLGILAVSPTTKKRFGARTLGQERQQTSSILRVRQGPSKIVHEPIDAFD